MAQKLSIEKCEFFFYWHISIEQKYFCNSNLRNHVVNGNAANVYVEF